MNPMLTFFKGLFNKHKPGIGIELTPDRINVVELQKKGNVLKLAALATAEVPENVFQDGQIIDSPTMVEIIQSTLKDNNIKIKHVATAIPGREAVIRLIPVPVELDDQELREYMNAESGLYLPFPREEADVDYQKLGLFVDEDGSEKVQVILVATRKEVTETYIKTFTEAGLKLDVIEVSSFALIRTLREQLQQFSSQEAAVIANIDFDSTELAIVVDGVPQFNRTIPIGTFQIQSALNQAMNLPASRDTSKIMEMTLPVTDSMPTGGGDANPQTTAMMKVLGELADELRRSIDFYMNQSDELEVAQLLLAGPGSAIGKIDEFFMQRLSLPASQVDPVESLALELNDEIAPETRSALGVALGLGVREV
jgi:type IV pilus assembly protein PilM